MATLSTRIKSTLATAVVTAAALTGCASAGGCGGRYARCSPCSTAVCGAKCGAKCATKCKAKCKGS